MKSLFKLIAFCVIVLQLVLLFEKGNDLIFYDTYLGLPKGSYGYPVPYHKIVSIFCLVTLFIVNILVLIIKKSNLFYHTSIAFSVIYMLIVGFDLYLHRYSNPIMFNWVLFVSLAFLVITLLIPRFNDLNSKLNIYVLIVSLTFILAILMSLLWFDVI